MIQKIKILVLSFALVGLIGLVPAAAVHADAASDACDGVKLIDPSAKCDDTAAGQKGFSDILKTIINTFSIVVGAVSVVMIIIGGFRYVISGGDSSATKGAKDTILYAVIGLAVVIFAQVIVRFVITQTTAKPAPAKKKDKATSLILTA